MEVACEAGEGAERLRGLTILGPLGDPQIPDPDNAGEGKTSRRSLLSMPPLKATSGSVQVGVVLQTRQAAPSSALGVGLRADPSSVRRT
jgi:hypothetical protein